MPIVINGQSSLPSLNSSFGVDSETLSGRFGCFWIVRRLSSAGFLEERFGVLRLFFIETYSEKKLNWV